MFNPSRLTLTNAATIISPIYVFLVIIILASSTNVIGEKRNRRLPNLGLGKSAWPKTSNLKILCLACGLGSLSASEKATARVGASSLRDLISTRKGVISQKLVTGSSVESARRGGIFASVPQNVTQEKLESLKKLQTRRSTNKKFLANFGTSYSSLSPTSKEWEVFRVSSASTAFASSAIYTKLTASKTSIPLLARCMKKERFSDQPKRHYFKTVLNVAAPLFQRRDFFKYKPSFQSNLILAMSTIKTDIASDTSTSTPKSGKNANDVLATDATAMTLSALNSSDTVSLPTSLMQKSIRKICELYGLNPSNHTENKISEKGSSSVEHPSRHSTRKLLHEVSLQQAIHESILLLQQLDHNANTFTFEEGSDPKGLGFGRIQLKLHDPIQSQNQQPIDILVKTLIEIGSTTNQSLQHLIERANKHKAKAKKKASSGQAWKALQSVVERALGTMYQSTDSQPNNVQKSDAALGLSRAFAWLAMGIVLAINKDDSFMISKLDNRQKRGKDTSSTSKAVAKMVSSAVLPNHPKDVFCCLQQVDLCLEERERKKQKDEPNHDKSNIVRGYQEIVEGGEEVPSEGVTYSLARAIVLDLLRLASENDGLDKHNLSIDLQVIAKIVNGFGIGDREVVTSIKKISSVGTLILSVEDEEFSKAVACVVNQFFGTKHEENGQHVESTADSSNAINDNDTSLNDNNFITISQIEKHDAAPTLALVARTPPWNFVQFDFLVAIAAEMDLWHSAELICDAAVAYAESIAQIKSRDAWPDGPNASNSTFDTPDTTNDIHTEGTETVAHVATKSLIDTALDYRLYRRADSFATKYYVYGGPERFAEARFLHACDTISKLVKKKQIQIIDKQVERIDESVARVKSDSSWGEGSSLGGRNLSNSDSVDKTRSSMDSIVLIETMSHHVREFSLRRLRESKSHSAAVRLAQLWGMTYDHDPVVLMQEEKLRKLTYLQWMDDGCPGSFQSGKITIEESGEHIISGDGSTLPELISDPSLLLMQFHDLIRDEGAAVGFDAEWGDIVPGVSLLQLSTITQTLLLDIPALSATPEGCDALRKTVGKLFSGSTSVKSQVVVGFGCKEDFSRLRASKSIGKEHWFPQRKLVAKDLRVMIKETYPALGGRGGMHLGLSRACEYFLGKQLDKAEQCSDWSRRPLSAEQREYAALDAWACAAIHKKIEEDNKP